MAEVVLRNVKKIYKTKRKKRREEVVAVKNLNLVIEDGEFLALLGPSGCGKTTTLRMIVGLESITEGEVLIGGNVVNDWTPAQRNVAMAFETYALYSHLSVRDNLGLCLKAKGVPAVEIQEQVERIAEVLRITDILDARSSGLSGGQQQRVSLGRALIRHPSVSLLDEPLSHLDASLRLETRMEIKRIHQRLKGTFIFVTHDQMEALALSDRVAVMNFAELQQVGTRGDLYDRPANVFVADFVGEPPINLFANSRIESRKDDLYVVTPQGEFAFKLPGLMKRKIEAKAPKGVTIGIRPQYLNIQGGEGKEALSGKVSVFEFLGETGNLTIASNGLDINLVAPPDIGLDVGAPADIYYDPNKVLLFDSESGKNIFYESA
jgi:multiple sugar transport system ATP-binding protein